MRIVCVAGTLDSGKTTLIRELTTVLSSAGKRCAVIVNEEGEQSYDDDFINSRQVMVEFIRGG